jgi:hypothetical protein
VKVFLSYALSLAGLGFVLAAVIGATIVNLSYPAARMRLVNMIHTNLNKAEIMCRTGKGTFFEPVGSAIKIAAMSQTTDLQMLALATKPGYDAGVMPVTMHWKTLFGRGKKGVALVVGGLAMAIAVKTSPILHIIIAIGTAIAAAWFIHTRSENERSLLRARAEILPEVERAFSEGKYTRYG